MKRRALLASLCLATIATALSVSHPTQACDRGQAIVSTQWLSDHLNRPDLVVVDLRSVADYAAGHIAGAVSIPLGTPQSAWVTVRDGLSIEVPAETDLFATLSAAGIRRDAFVVVVNNLTALGPRVLTARVALTLTYAGVQDTAILDGGFSRWVQEGRPQSTEAVTPTPVTYKGRVDKHIFVSKADVEASLDNPRVVLLDARDPALFSGATPDASGSGSLGHLPGALNLFSALIWNDDGTFKSKDELRALAAGLLGGKRHGEIIVYCSLGGVASGWWFVLTQVLGYDNVKFYDGSIQEWVLPPAGPLVVD